MALRLPVERHNPNGVTIVEAIERVVNRQPLTEDEARSVMAEVMTGTATPAQIAGLLVALRMKGETTSEVVGFAREMRAHVTPVPTTREKVVDTCGTGGDTLKTFNISTAAAIIASAAGATVAKHGNRAVTSKCGSADVLEALGVNLNLNPIKAARLLDEIGLAFLFAPNYHPAMKHAAAPRREVRLRSVFNLLGPLTNPAGAKRQVVGVSSPNLVPRIARALRRLGAERAIVVYGEVGMDELAPVGRSRLAVLDGQGLHEVWVTPNDFGTRPVSPEAIAAGQSPAENAEKLKRALTEPRSREAEASLPSAGLAVWAAGLAEGFEEATALARRALESGEAAAKLTHLVRLSQEVP